MGLSARRGTHRHDQRGIALSSPVALLSAAAVVLAGIAFFSTGGADEPAVEAAKPVRATPHPSRSATPTPVPATKAPAPVIRKKKHVRPAVRRGDTFVEVYNNSGIHGLAGRLSARASGAGWQVVGTDNWYGGNIPASTVYYPARLHDEARLLARDLGIHRLKGAIAPMRLDRLTVILTGDLR